MAPRHLPLLTLVSACTASAPLPPDEALPPDERLPPDQQPTATSTALTVERFDPARHTSAPSDTHYRSASDHPKTWLEVARSPDGAAIAVARETDVELRAWPGLLPLWRVSVSPDDPYRTRPSHPLLAFTPDGGRLAWLGGVGHQHRFLLIDPSGAPQFDLAFPSLPEPSSGGGGVTPPPTPAAMHAIADGRRFDIFNSFARYQLDPAAPALTVDNSQGGMRPIRAHDSQAAWDNRNAVLTRRGGGGEIKLDCDIYEQDIAIDERLDRIAYLCAGGGDRRPEIRLRRLSSGEQLAAFPFVSKWGRIVILDAHSLLALASPDSGPRYTALLSTVAPAVRTHDPATDAWTVVGP
jgi:hypothetical protein